MRRRCAAVLFSVAVLGCSSAKPAPDQLTADPLARVIARGDSLALPGTWEAPPGDPLVHHTSGFAKTLCSAVFITGLDPADAAETVGYFTGPKAERVHVVDTVVDRASQTVRLRLASGVTRVAKRYGSQGCITHSLGADSIEFTPSVVRPNLPDAVTTPWPMGDRTVSAPWPAELDSAKVAAALEAGFGPPDAMTLAFLVTHKGRIIAERYAAGIGPTTPLESWSMGKSLTGSLIAVLIQQGVYRLDQPAPIPEWQGEGDARKEIRIVDIMRMSSGIRLRAPQDPGYDPSLGYPDHLYLYTGPDAFAWASSRPQQWKPNTVGRYRNTDPALAGYLVRLAVEGRGENYHAFPQRQLFDKIGIRNAVMETDPKGNFLTQGYELVAARDWARLANLYLQDGVWNGERILPEGYAAHVRTVAPAWEADGRPVYGGGFFWVNGDGAQPLPRDAYSMQGAGGQYAYIVPSHDLVIVRLGKYKGASEGSQALGRAMTMLMEAVPVSGPAPAPR